MAHNHEAGPLGVWPVRARCMMRGSEHEPDAEAACRTLVTIWSSKRAPAWHCVCARQDGESQLALCKGGDGEG
jgi:hypothetical protein